MSNWWNTIWRGSIPCWWKMVHSVTTVSKVCQREFAHDVPTYMGMPFIGGIFPRSPASMIDQFPKGTFWYEGNTSLKRSSMCERILGPIKLISSVKMYLMWNCFSWRCRSGWTSRGCIYTKGMQRAEWIVSTSTLNMITLVGASRSNVLELGIDSTWNVSFRKWMK